MPVETWLLTGASSGIGRALCQSLLARGHRVAATARNPAALHDLAPAEADRWWAGQLDVTDHAQIRTAVAEAFATFGRIDVVVSNAGYALFGAAEEVSDEQIDRQIATNLIGPIQVARAVLPYLRAQGAGRIIQVGSSTGQVPLANTTVYNATKWGVEGFFDSLAIEVAEFGIDVTIVEPGSVATGFTGRSRDIAPALPDYAHTPAARARYAMEEGLFRQRGDVDRMAEAIIDSAGRHPAPRRLPLGTDAYVVIRKALRDRLAAHEKQEVYARGTDADNGRAR